jgi:DNA-binding XRE family transcriptional regulator
MIIGEQIRKYRNRAGITQKDLAEMIGVTPITIQNYENNRREPNLEKITAIANALKISIYNLVENKSFISESIFDLLLDYGFTVDDMCKKTGLSPDELRKIIHSNEHNSKTKKVLIDLLSLILEGNQTASKNEDKALDNIENMESNLLEYLQRVILNCPIDKVEGFELKSLNNNEIIEIAKALEFTFKLKISELKSKNENY